MRSIYLKFTGASGLATTIGVLSLLVGRELLIILGLMLILTVVTRNPALSINISLLSLPVSAWWLEQSGLLVAFSLILVLILMLNFLPTVRAALAGAGSGANLAAELLWRNEAVKEEN